MHAGRIAHPDNKDGLETVAPSALAAPNEMFTAEGPKPHPVPRALETDEIPGVVEDFVHAARSRGRGRPRRRRDARRQRLPAAPVPGAGLQRAHRRVRRQPRRTAPGSTVEVTRAVAEAIGPERVGIRISPAHNIQGATEEDPADVEATYTALVEGIAPLGIAYLSVLADPCLDLVQRLRKEFGGVLIANDGFGELTTRKTAQAVLDDDLADAVAVGRLFLANPDLPRRWQTGAELNEPDPDTFYGGGAEGYTDYPVAGRLTPQTSAWSGVSRGP